MRALKEPIRLRSTKAISQLLVVLVAGCSTVSSDNSGTVRGSPEWFEKASPRETADYFRGQCVASGVMVGTRQMAECIEREASLHGRSDVATSAATAASTAPN